MHGPRPLLVLLAVASGACSGPGVAPPPAPAPLPAEARSSDALLAADRAFARDAEADGLDGWVRWFDVHAVRMPIAGPVAQGHPAIRAADAGLFADPEVLLVWEPEIAGLIAPGELGFTRGRYELVRRTDAGEAVLGTGTYFSIWRWTADGWRVALDGGVPDRP